VKFRTERDSLLEAIATAGRAASPRGTGAGTPSLQLTLRSDRLDVVGADPDLVIEVSTTVGGESDGSTLVPARLVTEIVRSFDPGTVTFLSDDEEARLSSGRAEFTVRIPVGAAITRLGPPEGEGIVLPAQLFAEGLRQVVRAALTDDSRAPQLTGVLMVATETGLRLVATDSYRLAYRDLEGVSALEAGSEVLVPARALVEIQRLVGSSASSASSGGAAPATPSPASGSSGTSAGEERRLVFRHSELDAVFDLDATRLTTRLLSVAFPQYERLIPASYPNALTAGREELTAALRRVRLMVRDAKDAATPVRITFAPEGAELRVLTAETGQAVEHIDGSFEGEELTVAFNPGYLLDGVEAIRSERVVLEVIDGTKPATVRGEGDDAYRYLLMPVRVS
jgi:DNA polymerase-3 subunit beta